MNGNAKTKGCIEITDKDFADIETDRQYIYSLYKSLSIFIENVYSLNIRVQASRIKIFCFYFKNSDHNELSFYKNNSIWKFSSQVINQKCVYWYTKISFQRRIMNESVNFCFCFDCINIIRNRKRHVWPNYLFPLSSPSKSDRLEKSMLFLYVNVNVDKNVIFVSNIACEVIYRCKILSEPISRYDKLSLQRHNWNCVKWVTSRNFFTIQRLIFIFRSFLEFSR